MNVLDDTIISLASETVAALAAADAMLVTAESCTGGLIAGALTSVSGSSAVVHGGYVTYANRAKVEMIGVQAQTLSSHGGVSEQTVREMAAGARSHANVSHAIAVTGIAGPSGGSADKPVGLVWFGLATKAGLHSEVRQFGDIGREAVRRETVRVALEIILADLRA